MLGSRSTPCRSSLPGLVGSPAARRQDSPGISSTNDFPWRKGTKGSIDAHTHPDRIRNMGGGKKFMGGCADRMDFTHGGLPDPLGRSPVRFHLLRYLLRSSTYIFLCILKKFKCGDDGKGSAVYRACQRALASASTLGT